MKNGTSLFTAGAHN